MKFNDELVEVTLTLDTNVYADADVLADTQEIPDAVFERGNSILRSVRLLDNDDQAGALDIVILRSDTSIGTENSSLAISDANADEILTVIPIAAEDYVDLINSQLVTKNETDEGCGVMLAPADDSTSSLYIAAISRDTKTYTAAGIEILLGFEKR